MSIRFSLLVVVLASLAIWGCKGDSPAPVAEEEEEVGSGNPIDELEVPAGFNYSTAKLIAFNSTMIVYLFLIGRVIGKKQTTEQY